MHMNIPELLSPAGDWSSLYSAVENGADSVYFGIKNINMRHMASNFDLLELDKVMGYLHKNKVKGYLTLNTIISDSELLKVDRILKAAKKAGVDAVILWDMAVLKMAKDLGLVIHISTQASVANFESLKMYSGLGAKRVVLARECTLAEIKKIISKIEKEKIDCSVETFIHGAMCVSISGRCFLSQYTFGKSANKGQCLQPCRREFLITDKDGESQYILGEDYVLSPKDLCSIDFIDELVAAGIASFKIEGRMRSAEYVKVTTNCYRKAIDACIKGKYTKKLKAGLKEELAKVFNRGFHSGFYFGKPSDDKSNRLEHSYEKIFLGEVTRFFKKIGVAEIRLRTASLSVGEQVLFIGKSTPADSVRVDEIQSNNEFVKSAKKGETIGVKLPFVVKPRDKVFIWRRRDEDN